MQKLGFSDFDSFLSWKNDEESRTTSMYVQLCAPQMRGDNQHWYYYCHRSGNFQPKGKGKRQLKTQGSCKTGECCVAHIKATRDMCSGKVNVEYCPTHHSHDVTLGHLTMSKDTRMKIAAKLHQGVTIERILDDIRENTSQGITREHLL